VRRTAAPRATASLLLSACTLSPIHIPPHPHSHAHTHAHKGHIRTIADVFVTVFLCCHLCVAAIQVPRAPAADRGGVGGGVRGQGWGRRAAAVAPPEDDVSLGRRPPRAPPLQHRRLPGESTRRGRAARRRLCVWVPPDDGPGLGVDRDGLLPVPRLPPGLPVRRPVRVLRLPLPPSCACACACACARAPLAIVAVVCAVVCAAVVATLVAAPSCVLCRHCRLFAVTWCALHWLRYHARY